MQAFLQWWLGWARLAAEIANELIIGRMAGRRLLK
jgi:hypothetical protein